ncbi:MAG: UDP-N-acetylmuramoyl-L-alanine--D-glutamate ligase [Candidatus Aminicenantes bacterium]|nr:UDP-N-acetylmuramoyl-L-alanine--D-glutamate ligase [Candidatus Aminicenantes bacterium]
MNLEGKKALVVGFGRTGEALVRFLLEKKAKIKVSEKKKPEELNQDIHSWRKKGVTFEAGDHNLASFLEADLIVVSPGVPFIPELRIARERGVRIISEIELAYQYLKGKIVGITGTNGKSTTATLTHKILNEGGLEAFLAGNIGTPLIDSAKTSRDDHVYVTEISSFQLYHIKDFKVDVSVFLNVSPDHLDWHSSFDDYYEAKKKLILSQRNEPKAILNRDDPLVWPLRKRVDFDVLAFSRKREVTPGCFLHKERIFLADTKKEELMKISTIPVFGVHNQENIMASALVGHVFGIPVPRMRESIKTFKGLEHRLEKILTLEGIDFYNDSKATNVDAALKSIQSFDRKIILVMGGRDKGGDFKRLKKVIKEKVKKIILIGEAREKIKEALNGMTEFFDSSSLKEAVDIGFSAAKSGEVVLLAPACTSFDMFKNFEERGRAFKKEVSNLEKHLKKGRA